MAAGTVVVTDETPELTDVRVELSGRKAVEAEFRFDGNPLEKMTAQYIEAIERLLDRWYGVSPDQRERLAGRLSDALAAKLPIDL